MSRRIDIELTSTRPDGTWTWRAAGAKEPKGVVDGGLLYTGAKAGDILKAEADFEIDGITIVSVATPKADGRHEPQHLEILGPSRPDAPGVTTQLVGRSDRRGPGRRRDGDPRSRGERPDRGDRPDRGERHERRSGQGSGLPADRRQRGPSAEGGAPERAGGHTLPDRRAGRRPPRDGSAPPPAHRAGRTDSADRAGREDRNGRPDRAARDHRAGRDARSGRADTGAASRSKRLNPGHAHRQAILESLAPEQRAVAEQVLRGGIPAVRTALHLEREKALAEGRPAPNTDQLIAMAEDLLPRLKAADWRDRAEAAVKFSDEISIRDLRSVVAGADAARDEETRALAASLREALDRRLSGLNAAWSEEIAKQLDDGRVVRALRLSARPPEPSTRLEDDLAKRLSAAAGESMSADASPNLWLALLEAAAASPLRRSITPSGLPADGGEELRQAALQQSGRIPALAAMLGVSIPPPPSRRPSLDRRPPPDRRPSPDRRPAAEAVPASGAEAPPASGAEAPPAPGAPQADS